MAEKVKKSEILAIENVKRIADVLRVERNDAIAWTQELNEELEIAVALLHRASAALADVDVDDLSLRDEITTFCARPRA